MPSKNHRWCSVVQPFLDFVAPPLCVNCGQRISEASCYPPPFWCVDCRQQVEELDVSIIDKLHQQFPYTRVLDAVIAVYHYRGPLPAAIHSLKYHGRRSVAAVLGHRLGERLKVQEKWKLDVIVPVPLHPARRRERGYNQADIIADAAARVLDLPVQYDWIRRIHWTMSQTQLSESHRWDNVRQAFAAKLSAYALQGATVVLVDDVITTGATCSACAAVLRDAGAQTVIAAVLAAAV